MLTALMVFSLPLQDNTAQQSTTYTPLTEHQVTLLHLANQKR